MILIIIYLAFFGLFSQVLAMEPVSNPNEKIKIQAFDAEGSPLEGSSEIELPIKIAIRSNTIKNMIEDVVGGGIVDLTIPIINIAPEMLELVIDRLRFMQENPERVNEKLGSPELRNCLFEA